MTDELPCFDDAEPEEKAESRVVPAEPAIEASLPAAMAAKSAELPAQARRQTHVTEFELSWTVDSRDYGDRKDEWVAT